MPFSRWEHIILSNCCHSICPYVLVSGVMDNLPALFPSMGGKSSYSLLRSLLASWKSVHFLTVCRSLDGWHIRISFVFPYRHKVKRNTEIKTFGGKCRNRTALPHPKCGVQNHYTSFSI